MFLMLRGQFSICLQIRSVSDYANLILQASSFQLERPQRPTLMKYLSFALPAEQPIAPSKLIYPTALSTHNHIRRDSSSSIRLK